MLCRIDCARFLALIFVSFVGLVTQPALAIGELPSSTACFDALSGVHEHEQPSAPATIRSIHFSGFVPAGRRAWVSRGASTAFVELVMNGRMMGQLDARLEARGLILPGDAGGLCAPTCGINSLHALFTHAGIATAEFALHSDHYVQQMINMISQLPGPDRRLGVNAEQLGLGMIITANSVAGRPGIADRSARISVAEMSITEAHLEVPEDHIKLAAVTSSEGAAHRIVILGVNTELKEVTYSDPYFPHAIFTTSYSIANYHGQSTVLMRWPREYHRLGIESGYILDLFDIFLTAR